MANRRPATADRKGEPRTRELPRSTSYDYRYQKRWRYDRAHGITRTMPAEPIRTHLRDLIERGASVRGIGEVAGVPTSVVSRIARGQQPTVTRRLAAALGAVTMSSLTGRPNPEGFVPKIGAGAASRPCRRSAIQPKTSQPVPGWATATSTTSSTSPGSGSPAPSGRRSPRPMRLCR